jgi:hypothetical protein
MATSLQDSQVHYPSIIRTNAQHPQPPPFPYRKLSHTTETTGINKHPINLTDCGILQSQLSESFFVKTISKIFPSYPPRSTPVMYYIYQTTHPIAIMLPSPRQRTQTLNRDTNSLIYTYDSVILGVIHTGESTTAK